MPLRTVDHRHRRGIPCRGHAIRTFTIADGLPRNYTNCIQPDSKGFLWLCTAEGVSRYDGYQFVPYGVSQGLPDRRVNDILETRSGNWSRGPASPRPP